MDTTLPVTVNVPQENITYLFSFYSLPTMLMAPPLFPLSPYAPFSEEQQTGMQLPLTTWFIRAALSSSTHGGANLSKIPSSFSHSAPSLLTKVHDSLKTSIPPLLQPNFQMPSPLPWFFMEQYPTCPKVAEGTTVNKSKSHHKHISEQKQRVVKTGYVHTQNNVQTWEQLQLNSALLARMQQHR